jgi:hypothetical protein
MALFIKVNGDKVTSYGKKGDIEIASWPVDPETGDPARKQEVYWDGSNVVLRTQQMRVDENKLSSVEKIDSLISTNIHKFSRRLNFNAILAVYDTYKDAIEAATTETDIQDAEDALMEDLYSE